jgi:hypothetical protein
VEKEVSLPAERGNKSPVYVSEMRNRLEVLEWIGTKSGSRIVAQMRGEYIMLELVTADGFRATIGALKSLDEGEGVSFHTFPLPEDRCLRLLLKNLGKLMHEHEISEELEATSIQVQAVMRFRWRRRYQDSEKDRLLAPHFIVSVPRGPNVDKVRSLTEICGLRIKVETYNDPKDSLQWKCCQRFFGQTQRNCIQGRGMRRRSPIQNHQLKCCSCGGNHTANYAVAVSGRMQKRPLQSEHNGSGAVRMASPCGCPCPKQLQSGYLWNRRS